MTDYRGPERRTIITFTREDSDRLVRLEEQLNELIRQQSEVHKIVLNQTARINKIERLQSWIMGIGAAVTFIITSAILWLKG